MCTVCTAAKAMDQAKSDQFAEKLLGVLNGAALALMLSIGHRTGLFDAMEGQAAMTSHELALRAGLTERYVREWLGAMTAGRIVEHDGAAMTYRLPAEHAAWLTRAATPNNLAVVAQFIPTLAQVEDRIVECFRTGGGVGYEHFPRFHEVMAEESAQTVVSALEEHILPLVPGLADRLRAGVRVLDVGCGRGRALLRLAQAFPHSEFIGVDMSRETVVWANERADELELDNVRFEVADAAGLAYREEFDLVLTFDAVHDQARPDRMLANIHRALKPGGVYLMQDIAGTSTHAGDVERPLSPLIYTISCMHCMTVSLSAGGMGLGAAWGERTAVSMLREAGFGAVEVKSLAHDMQNFFYIMRK